MEWSPDSRFILFVTLDAMYVEGLVHITDLGGEYFRFDEARQELRGERTGIRYALGTRVDVQVSRVDLDGRRIDFRLVTPDDDLVGRAMREKAGADAAAGRERKARRNEKPPVTDVKAAVRKAASKKATKSGAAGKQRKGRRG